MYQKTGVIVMRDYWTIYYYLTGKLPLEETKEELEEICWIADDEFAPHYGFYKRIDLITEYIGMVLYSKEKDQQEIAKRISDFLVTIQSDEVFVLLLERLLKSELIKKHIHQYEDLFKRLKQIA